MGTNVAPYYERVLESGHYGSDVASKAFDGSPDTFWESNAADGWIAIDFGIDCSAKVNKIRIMPRVYSGNAQCKDFVLIGSNDTTNGSDGSWDQVTTGQHGNNNNFEDFTFSNAQSYQVYKLQVTSSYRSDFAGGALCEVEMYADEYITNYVVPIMSSNNTPTPFAVSGSQNDSKQAPWMAFDANVATFYYTAKAQNENYIKIDLGVAVKIKGYVIRHPTRGATADLISYWVLQGSDDELTWDTLDTQTLADTTRNVWFKYSINPTQAYRHYQFKNLYAQGHAKTLIGDLNFIKEAEKLPPSSEGLLFATFI